MMYQLIGELSAHRRQLQEATSSKWVYFPYSCLLRDKV